MIDLIKNAANLFSSTEQWFDQFHKWARDTYNKGKQYVDIKKAEYKKLERYNKEINESLYNKVNELLKVLVGNKFNKLDLEGSFKILENYFEVLKDSKDVPDITVSVIQFKTRRESESKKINLRDYFKTLKDYFEVLKKSKEVLNSETAIINAVTNAVTNKMKKLFKNVINYKGENEEIKLHGKKINKEKNNNLKFKKVGKVKKFLKFNKKIKKDPEKQKEEIKSRLTLLKTHWEEVQTKYEKDDNVKVYIQELKLIKNKLKCYRLDIKKNKLNNLEPKSEDFQIHKRVRNDNKEIEDNNNLVSTINMNQKLKKVVSTFKDKLNNKLESESDSDDELICKILNTVPSKKIQTHCSKGTSETDQKSKYPKRDSSDFFTTGFKKPLPGEKINQKLSNNFPSFDNLEQELHFLKQQKIILTKKIELDKIEQRLDLLTAKKEFREKKPGCSQQILNSFQSKKEFEKMDLKVDEDVKKNQNSKKDEVKIDKHNMN